MFGSQAFETAIGLVFVFFVLALSASAITELLSQLLDKRAGDLKNAIGRIVAGKTKNLGTEEQSDREASQFVNNLYETSAIASLVAAAKRDPSYISASKFAEGIVEYLRSDDLDETIAALPENLQKRVQEAVDSVGANIAGIRAELEGWFDTAMDRLSGLYKRWARIVVLTVTVLIVVVANVDSIRISQILWESPVLREAVVAAAEDVGDPAQSSPQSLDEVATEIRGLEGLGLPIFWECPDGQCTDFQESAKWALGESWDRLPGWILTVLLVSLGAPFWYGLLTQLISLRSSGSKPKAAPDDDTSMTSLLAQTETISIESRETTLADAVGRVRAQSALTTQVDLIAETVAPRGEAPTWEAKLKEALAQTVTR